MVIRIKNKDMANQCDLLLGKLINDERQYDSCLTDNIIVKDYFKNVVQNDENYLFGYLLNNIIVGYIYLKPIQDGDKKGYLIDGLYVEEEHRNKGYGKELIKISMNLLIEKDVSFFDINVMFNNNIAKYIYKEIGFHEFRITMRKEIENEKA